jgi:GNAT superfamily N-acetyltransferase
MSQPAYRIETMTPAHLDQAIAWAADEGWNPGLGDRDCFYAADPQGFLMGTLAGQPIASLSVVKYSDRFGFLGFYIVHPDYRGQGYGWQLWQAGLAYLEGCTIGLDGVMAQQANYGKSGFALAYRNLRYQGIGPGDTAAPSDLGDRAIVALATVPFDRLLAYDRAHFPSDRAAFLQAWITQPGSTALGLLQGDDLVGYGVLRPCREGYKLGPLFAPDADGATALFLQLRSRVPAGQPVYLDVPAVNGAAVALARSAGMTLSFETARMYRGPAPDLPLAHIFGVTSFELG